MFVSYMGFRILYFMKHFNLKTFERWWFSIDIYIFVIKMLYKNVLKLYFILRRFFQMSVDV